MSTDSTTPTDLDTAVTAEADALFSHRVAKAQQRRDQDHHVRQQLQAARDAGKTRRHEQRLSRTELLDQVVTYALTRARTGLCLVDIADDVHEHPDRVREALTRLQVAGRVTRQRNVWLATAAKPTH